MTPELWSTLAAGARALVGWAGLLDRINVYPVADGDTGTNLVASLAPLRAAPLEQQELRRELLLAARGNSGNIASQFFAGLLAEPCPEGLGRGIATGRALAWAAVPEPQAGTMLSLFDALAEQVPPSSPPLTGDAVADVLLGLERAVRRTPDQLPVLARAGVVDAGALGMFIFLERFLCALVPVDRALPSVAQRFGAMLQLQRDITLTAETGFCIDAVIRADAPDASSLSQLGALGQSAVIHHHDGLLKVHVHTADVEALRQQLGRAGEVVRFAADDLGAQTRAFTDHRPGGPVHLVTDAAGSMTADDAAQLGVTLLSSYIQCAGRLMPESEVIAQELYEAMRRGVRVSTSQASVQQRHDCFTRLVAEHPRVLYLTVGSAYSGIHDVAAAWQREHDATGRLRIVDSAAAAGKLGLAVLATAEFARSATDADAVVGFARQALAQVDELVFLDRLKYLAAGGRLSKTASFFGEALRLKPIMTLASDGVRKVGTVRSQRDQLAFARARIASLPPVSGHYLVLLQHTDNEAWLREVLAEEIPRRLPLARVLVRPLSLTSGAHMGPGTWALAYLGLSADGWPAGTRDAAPDVRP